MLYLELWSIKVHENIIMGTIKHMCNAYLFLAILNLQMLVQIRETRKMGICKKAWVCCLDIQAMNYAIVSCWSDKLWYHRFSCWWDKQCSSDTIVSCCLDNLCVFSTPAHSADSQFRDIAIFETPGNAVKIPGNSLTLRCERNFAHT